MEVEIDRFEGAKGAALKKYQYVAQPDPKPKDLATTGVDAVVTLALGEPLAAAGANHAWQRCLLASAVRWQHAQSRLCMQARKGTAS